MVLPTLVPFRLPGGIISDNYKMKVTQGGGLGKLLKVYLRQSQLQLWTLLADSIQKKPNKNRVDCVRHWVQSVVFSHGSVAKFVQVKVFKRYYPAAFRNTSF